MANGSGTGGEGYATLGERHRSSSSALFRSHTCTAAPHVTSARCSALGHGLARARRGGDLEVAVLGAGDAVRAVLAQRYAAHDVGHVRVVWLAHLRAHRSCVTARPFHSTRAAAGRGVTSSVSSETSMACSRSPTSASSSSACAPSAAHHLSAARRPCRAGGGGCGRREELPASPWRAWSFRS